MTFGKKVALWAILAAVLYALMGYHYIFEGLSVPWVLKKSHWTLNYTFFSIHGKTNDAIVAIDELRQDGIADLLVRIGRMSEDERELLLYKYAPEEEEEDSS